ncbi:Biopolymer transport protein exbB [Serratia quinivorans]|jgi:biopolymer transport protein ExbB|uniref:MotA/TolQ/ExbB proton channel family protein n=1 Tax=Serratia quinivorans TaxID=137545 RepID=UPI0021779EB6|nr:MotA/TolQ/ExbB proton channel family protein [Serratia quinivorans]CAI1097608.1 Biopolymer transport protein exbB [Serratia quinivorans]CAI1169986.1 Biopolymer transport protein exbB [Serratia quinivorans]CAI1903541.1 Biopolymer transport protein exbB [Serratia quinivorans]CAI2142472.1 Biopolymer transport protein exbB [Serratia quinivorans]CAI2503290.1 Biopolymer transport protein exbB [Serratia quinivorans]
MNANLMHDIIFYVMYAALAIALVIIIERALYFAYTQRQACKLEQALTLDVRRTADLPDELTQRNSLPLAVISPVLEQKHRAGDREAIGDLIDAQYLLSKPLMARGLWLLETIVTAAPLLGLLGTVMGIIETFKALAASGVSEPSLVSAGMGTALYATGLGIAIALLCLVGNNYLQSRMERINELLKVLLIRAGAPTSRPENGNREQWVDSEAPRYA